MAQSPVVITGLSSSGTASVFLGGSLRNVQVSAILSAGSSTPEGSIYVTGGDTLNGPGAVLLSAGNPVIGDYYRSSVNQGFYQYINVRTESISSSYFDDFVVRVYFDGAQWPSS
jgi:hypothetical protein